MEVIKKKRKVEGAVGKSGINYDFQYTGWSSDESEDAQVYSPRNLLEKEAKRARKSFRHRRIEWAALYPEVESFQDGGIYLMDLLPLLIGKMGNQMIEEDKGETTSNYELILLMANVSKFHIGCLNAGSHN